MSTAVLFFAILQLHLYPGYPIIGNLEMYVNVHLHSCVFIHNFYFDMLFLGITSIFQFQFEFPMSKLAKFLLYKSLPRKSDIESWW